LNNDFKKGLWGKQDTQVKSPSRCLLVGDAVVITYFHDNKPFAIFENWHHPRQEPWTNVGFVDGHIDYIKMTADEDGQKQYSFQRGDGWTVLFDD